MSQSTIMPLNDPVQPRQYCAALLVGMFIACSDFVSEVETFMRTWFWSWMIFVWTHGGLMELAVAGDAVVQTGGEASTLDCRGYSRECPALVIRGELIQDSLFRGLRIPRFARTLPRGDCGWRIPGRTSPHWERPPYNCGWRAAMTRAKHGHTIPLCFRIL